MPELPEVETYRRYFEATCLHQPIEAIDVGDRKLLTTDYATLTRNAYRSDLYQYQTRSEKIFLFIPTAAVRSICTLA